MKLRPKIILVLAVVLGAAMLAIFAIQQFIMYPSFVALEREEALEDWDRSRGAIDREIDHLSLLCLDWSSWDDTYKFALGTFPGYYDANIGKRQWFADQKLDAFYVCRPDGTVAWGQVLNLKTLEPATLAWLPPDRLPADHPLLAVKDEKESVVGGLVMTERGLMMFSSRPILTSQNEGPRAGVLIFGRLLSADYLQSLKEQTRVDFTIVPANSSDIPEKDRAGVAEALRVDRPLVDTWSQQHLSVRGVLKDIAGQPVAVIQADIEREIVAKGRQTMRFASASLLAAGALTLLTLIAGMRIIILTPLAKLTRHATQIATSGNMRSRIEMDRKDELGVLIGEFNGMLAKLETYRAQSMAMSRNAGMAEMTTGVLHNIGNAITSANVLAETLSEKAAQSKVAGLSKAVAMMDAHRDDLARFMTEDPKGRQLPAFLSQLAQHLHLEMTGTQSDLGALRDGLQHVKQIVAAQQDFAKCSNVAEPHDLHTLAERAVSLVAGSMTKHKITVVFQAESKPTVFCDGSKLQQVLVNLLTNAKDAIRDSRLAAREIRVRMGQRDAAKVFLEVRDSGLGIKPEDIDKIFNSGFTTKADGHGFGLHYSSLAIHEMGGTISAGSDGPGRGAVFQIVLPAHTEAIQEAA